MLNGVGTIFISYSPKHHSRHDGGGGVDILCFSQIPFLVQFPEPEVHLGRHVPVLIEDFLFFVDALMLKI